MSESKYRIPRLAMAVMVLGACGDDGDSGNKGTPSTGNDAGGSSNRDAGSSSGRDAGVSTGSDAGTATSAELDRLGKVGTTLCKLVLSCKDGDFAPLPNEQVSFKDEKECLSQFKAEFTPPLNASSDGCRDAWLSYYECYVGSGCTVDTEKCAMLLETYYTLCDGEPLSE